MTWSETHRRHAVLSEVEAAIERQGGGPLPWRREYAEVFGDRDALLIALRARWRQRLDAQLDPELPDRVLAQTRLDLQRRHRGLARMLAGRPGAGTSPTEEGGVRVG